MSERRFESFEEFWPYYALEHSKPETQAMHAVGTALGLTALGGLLVTRKAWLVPAGLAAAYGMAWLSHYRIEGNKPATFKYPLWSLMGDFKMFGKIVQGQMTDEVARARQVMEARNEALGGPSTIDMG